MKKILLIVLFWGVVIFAQNQGGLMVMPRHLNFMDNFNRSQVVYVENSSMNNVTIDSITYNPNVYFIRLNDVNGFPVEMQQDSKFSFEVIQYNYFDLQPEDSSSTITIYNSSSDPEITLQIHHHQQMHQSMKGEVSGTVRDSISALAGATVYFFYNRIMLIDSVQTDVNGNFEKELPEGEYFAASKKDGYYLKYANDKDSPLGADLIYVSRGIPANLDFVLEEEVATNLNISGVVSDFDDGNLENAVVVIRKGKHTPTKISAYITDDVNRSYTTFTDDNGFYNLKNVKYSGEYYVQAFAPFNIPGYYNKNNLSSVYWQDADSVEFFGSLDNINISLERDSSYGAGFVEGSVLSNNSNSPVTDAIVYVRSTNTNRFYTYNFVASDGNYSIPVLPYGEYELIAQKIGSLDAMSNTFSISTSQDSLSGINLNMIITDLNIQENPISYKLFQNYPNPFNPNTTIKFSLLKAGDVELNIYNFLGQKITTLLDKNLNAGTYQLQFDGGNLASGVYFYELITQDRKVFKKMNLLK